MSITITTPALLFPAISLLLLAYTNRFLSLANLIRQFSKEDVNENTAIQIRNLRSRMHMIKRMQASGVGSFCFCVISMLAIYLTYQKVGDWLFGVSLVMLLYSLWESVREIHISLEALEVHLEDMDFDLKKKEKTDYSFKTKKPRMRAHKPARDIQK